MGETAKSQVATFAENIGEDRRRIQRLEISLPARICPFDPVHRHLQEVLRTLNFNRAGVYFTTRLEHYSLGMQVLLALPYSSASSVQREYVGKVVRLEPLSDGSQGVAVQFLF